MDISCLRIPRSFENYLISNSIEKNQIHVNSTGCKGLQRLFVYLFMCASFPDQMKNNVDPFSTNTPHKHILKPFFFFEKLILRAASLEKLPRYMDFRISPRLPCFLEPPLDVDKGREKQSAFSRHPTLGCVEGLFS